MVLRVKFSAKNPARTQSRKTSGCEKTKFFTTTLKKQSSKIEVEVDYFDDTIAIFYAAHFCCKNIEGLNLLKKVGFKKA